MSWRLFLPSSWDEQAAGGRRARGRIPDGEHHRPKWQLAVDMLDKLAVVGLRPAVLVADTGYGANVDFRHAVQDRGLACAGHPADNGAMTLTIWVDDWQIQCSSGLTQLLDSTDRVGTCADSDRRRERLDDGLPVP
ncbi:transposase [Streptomyces sp. NPDC096354]|uniref:transposase n=1 Tax=Streptomyces sp. NPDC096354 TaxID=3366088 RepID=UPI0038251D8C